MGRPSKAVMDFMAKYKVDSDEIWEVHGSTWVIKHKALERVATEQGIVWDKPELKVCDMAQGLIAILIGGKLGDRTEYSFGEASPKNNKNAYPIAMAEKRAKDRVILKLLTASGELYSEEEADDFKQPERATEEIIKRDDGIQILTVEAQRPIFSELQKEISKCETPDELKRWKLSARSRASRLSGEWRKALDGLYLKHLRQLEATEADEYIERMTG